MDVVRRNIEQLRGRIDIDSTPGIGTLLTLSLPLTLSIIDGLIVMIGGQRFVVPALAIREIVRPTPDMIASFHGIGELVRRRDRLVPLLRLHENFGLEPATTDPTQAMLVAVEYGGESRCIWVDGLIGKQEVVIKRLGEPLTRAQGISGGAILSDGTVALIIDVAAISTATAVGG